VSKKDNAKNHSNQKNPNSGSHKSGSDNGAKKAK